MFRIYFILYREKEKRGVGGFLCSWKVVSIVLTLFTLLLASTIIYLGGEQLHREREIGDGDGGGRL